MSKSPAAVKPPRLAVCCRTCGSEDVRLDAWAEWNISTQRWQLSQTFDAAYCNNCECDKSHLEWKTIG